jgi:hypothetical protein
MVKIPGWPPLPLEQLPIQDVVTRIETLNRNLARFWSKAQGWAPIEAAGLLSKSRLDWQMSLSSSLRLWLRDPPQKMTDGDLILAWANLGSLAEGSLKLFLSVYSEDYRKEIEKLKADAAANGKKTNLLETPDTLTLEALKQFFQKHELLTKTDLALVELVQQRRNAIHAFKDRPIGTYAEFEKLRGYLRMLRRIAKGLPYPDEMYIPLEV